MTIDLPISYNLFGLGKESLWLIVHFSLTLTLPCMKHCCWNPAFILIFFHHVLNMGFKEFSGPILSNCIISMQFGLQRDEEVSKRFLQLVRGMLA